MPIETPSPVDLPEPEGRAGLLWTGTALAIAALILLLMNAVALSDWIDDLPPSPVQARAAGIAEAWVETADRVGLGRPRGFLHDQWKRAEAARFGSDQR